MRPAAYLAAFAFPIALGAADARPAGCPNIVGDWNSWASLLFGQADTTFKSDGAVVHRSGNSGVWKCVDGKIQISWGGQAPQLYTVQDDKIVNADGVVGFSRQPGTASPPAAAPVARERRTPKSAKPPVVASQKPKPPAEQNKSMERAMRALGL